VLIIQRYPKCMYAVIACGWDTLVLITSPESLSDV